MKEGERISQRTYVQDKDKDKDNSLVMAPGEGGTALVGSGQRREMGTSVIVATIKIKLKKLKGSISVVIIGNLQLIVA